MGRRKEISATEKLLELIRADDEQGAPDRREAANQVASSAPGEPSPAPAGAKGGRAFATAGSLWRRLAAAAPPLGRRGRRVTVGVSLRPGVLEFAVVGQAHGRMILQDHLVYTVEQEEGRGGADFDETWLDSAALKIALRRGLEVVQAGQAGRSRALEIWAELPWRQVDVHLLTIPRAASAEVANAVFWAARKNIEGFDPQTLLLDFVLQPGPENDNQQRAMVFLAPRKAVQRLCKLFRTVSFPLTGITAPTTGVRNLARQRRMGGAEQVFSHLRLEEHNSFISLFQDGDLVFSRDIKTGLNSILEAGAEPGAPSGVSPGMSPAPTPEPVADAEEPEPFFDLGLETETAATPDETGGEIEFSLPEPAEEPDAQVVLNIDDSVDEAAGEPANDPAAEPAAGSAINFDDRALTRLVRQLERTFDYCRTTLGLPRPVRVYIASPVRLGPALLDNIEAELGVGCAWLDPFDHAPGDDPRAPEPPADEHHRQLLAPAIGLAFCDQQHSQNFLLTYPDKDNRKLARQANHAVIGGFIFLALGLTGLYSWQQGVVGDLHQQYSQLDQQRRELATTQYDGAYLAGLAAEIRGHQDRIMAMARRQQLLLLLTEVQQLLPAEVTLLEAGAERPGKDGIRPGEEGIRPGDEGVMPGYEGVMMEIQGMIGGLSAERELQLARYLRRLDRSDQVREARIIVRHERETVTGEKVLFFQLQIKAGPPVLLGAG